MLCFWGSNKLYRHLILENKGNSLQMIKHKNEAGKGFVTGSMGFGVKHSPSAIDCLWLGASQIIHLQKRECKEKASHQEDPQKC